MLHSTSGMSFVIPKKTLHFTGTKPALGMPRGQGPRGRDLYRGAEIANDSKPLQPVARPAAPPPAPGSRTAPAPVDTSGPTTRPMLRSAPSAEFLPQAPFAPMPSVPPPTPIASASAHPMFDSDEMPTFTGRVEDWPLDYAQLGSTREGAPLRPPRMSVPHFRPHHYPATDHLAATVLTRPRRTLPGSFAAWIVAGLLLGLITCCATWAALGPRGARISAR